MKIVVYVEGPGDVACLETLLRPLLSKFTDRGTLLTFVPAPRGDRKKELLTNVPIRAANTVINDPNAVVVILPDLYPPNKGFRHTTCVELQGGVRERFRAAVSAKTAWDERLADRFQVFCLIHDLEVLLLASDELLRDRGLATPQWKVPVEEQNHGDPPKRVVERLFAPGSYQSTVDGPRILAKADYRQLAARCPEGFGRFVEWLEARAVAEVILDSSPSSRLSS